MSEDKPKVLGWGAIIGIMLATGLATGVGLAAARETLGLDPAGNTAGVGAAIGVVGGLLLAIRSRQLAAHNEAGPS